MAHQLGDHKKHLMTLMVTSLHWLTQQMYSTATHMAEVNGLYYMGTDFLVRKLDPLKVRKPGKEDKITDNK